MFNVVVLSVQASIDVLAVVLRVSRALQVNSCCLQRVCPLFPPFRVHCKLWGPVGKGGFPVFLRGYMVSPWDVKRGQCIRTTSQIGGEATQTIRQ